MPLPINVVLVMITGKYTLFSGVPAAGRVILTPSMSLVDTAALVRLVPEPLVSNLDVNGAFQVLVPSTDDSFLTAGLTYQVDEEIIGYVRNVYNIVVPGSSPVGSSGFPQLDLVDATVV